MTGSDEGGFRPHPGDPWHPGWIDDESGEEVESAPTEPEASEQEPKKSKKPKKPKRRSRRERRADQAAGDDLEPDFEPLPPDVADDEGVEIVVADVVEEVAAGVEPLSADVAEDPAVADPFDAVLEQEGPAPRLRSGADEEGPPPAWTIDEPPDPDQALPVEQPSWIGQTTGGTPGVESAEFESEQLEALEQSGSDADAGGSDGGAPGVESAEFESEQLEALEEDGSEADAGGADGEDQTITDPVFAADLGTAEVTDTDDEVVGEYGVAGPEAFDALAADDASADEIDDWESYHSDPEPKRRRRFRRRKESHVEEVIDDGFVGAATEPASETTDAEAGDSAFGRPDEPPAGVEAFDEWYEAEPVKKRGLFRRRKRAEPVIQDGFLAGEEEEADGWTAQPDAQPLPDETPLAPSVESVDDAAFLPPDELMPESSDQAEAGDVAAALTEALEALEVEDDSDAVEASFEPDPGVIPASGAGEQGDLFSEPDEPELVDQPLSESEVAAEPEGLDQVPEAELEDVAHWEGDPGRLPSDWMADIDEDEAVPPQVADTADTELVDQSREGTWEGQAQWQAEPVDLFDHEEPAAAAEAPQETVTIPEGYEPWQDAVADAVESGVEVEGEVVDDTYEYEQPLPLDGLPEGFEPFPGGAGTEQFELPEETMLSHLETNEFEEGWVTDDVDASAMPTEAMDVPYYGGTELDEEIYAAGGTIEHRDLAASIAEAGDEQTQWQAISAAMPGMETGVLGFEDVADLGSGGEYVAPIKSNLGARVATGLVLVAVLFGSLLLASEAFAVFISLVVMLGLVEFYGALRRAGYLPLGLFGIVGGIGTLAATWFHGPLAIPVGVLLTSTVTFFFYAFSPTRRDALSNGGLTTLGVGWVVATAAFAIPIGRAEERVVLVFAIVAVTAATDIGAYWFGRTWGKRPLASVLSPNKTTEGLVGAVVVALAAAGAIGFFELGPFDLKSGLALGFVAVFLAPIGDLAESMIKRSLGVKDMGSTLPGHGGILDRIDAFLFVIPAAWVFYEAIGFLG